MKFYLHETKKRNKVYTEELLKYLIKMNGHELTDISDADYLLLSMTGFQEFNRLVRLRKMAPNGKIIVGGHISFNPIPLLAYADYICVGQGFNFFRDIKKEKIDDLPYIMTRHKETVTPDQYIDWDNCPLIQIAKHSYSVLYSIGCKHKCSFCYTSWINKYQKTLKSFNPILKKLPLKNTQIYFISNDLDIPSPRRVGVTDVFMSDFLKYPHRYDNFNIIRVGLESPSVSTRRLLGKNISDSQISEFIAITKRLKKRCKIFMMTGLDNQNKWMDFIDIIGSDMDVRPKIAFILNYFEPMANTPLEDFDLSKIIEIDIPKVQYHWKLKNGRIILWGYNLKPIFPIFRTILSRSHYEHVSEIWKLRHLRKTNALFDALDKKNFIHLITKYEYKNPVMGYYESQKEKMKSKCVKMGLSGVR